MFTGTEVKASIALAGALIAVAAMLPTAWRIGARRAWSYGFYYVGYRVLAVQYRCGEVAVSGVPLMMKLA